MLLRISTDRADVIHKFIYFIYCKRDTTELLLSENTWPFGCVTGINLAYIRLVSHCTGTDASLKVKVGSCSPVVMWPAGRGAFVSMIMVRRDPPGARRLPVSRPRWAYHRSAHTYVPLVCAESTLVPRRACQAKPVQSAVQSSQSIMLIEWRVCSCAPAMKEARSFCQL